MKTRRKKIKRRKEERKTNPLLLTLHSVQHHRRRSGHHVPSPSLGLRGKLPRLPPGVSREKPECPRRRSTGRHQRVGRGEPPRVDAADHLVGPFEARGSCFVSFCEKEKKKEGEKVSFFFSPPSRRAAPSKKNSPSLFQKKKTLSLFSSHRGAGAASSAPRALRSTAAVPRRNPQAPGRARRRR